MMKFKTLTSWAAVMAKKNVDTDLIFPARHLKTVKRTGLGKHAFEAIRYDEKGNPEKGFILHQPPFHEAEILIAGANFGCGSSREHAVWALADLGIRAIISEQFAEIFASNAHKNHLLLITLEGKDVAELMERAAASRLTIRLQAQLVEVEGGNLKFPFEIGMFEKKCLLEGLDQIVLTLEHESEIAAHEERWKKKTPWLFND